MNNSDLLKTALRYRAVYLDIDRTAINLSSQPTAPVMALVARLRECGWTVSEELLHALCLVSPEHLAEIVRTIRDVMGMDLNWATLVKGWNVPTGETAADHLVTLFANQLKDVVKLDGVTLPCGHLIPDGTFPLERYTGCPFCGRPFVTADFVYTGQGSRLKELRLFTADDMRALLASLLASPTPLDATQTDSLKTLLGAYGLPADAAIAMKETAIVAASALVAAGDTAGAEAAGRLFTTPADILRYLWFEKTGKLVVIEPRTLIRNASKLYFHIFEPLSRSGEAAAMMKQKLRLRYTRRQSAIVARWLNALDMPAARAAENMNPKREMWVRMIRALRLGEYSRRKGFEKLAALLDTFYRHDYTTWQGQVDAASRAGLADEMLAMLQQRPGLFARCLFATMLRFGPDPVLEAFEAVSDSVTSRLLLSLVNAAGIYFSDDSGQRVVRPVTGVAKTISVNPMLALYSPADREAMARRVTEIFTRSLSRRFAALPTESKTIFIDPQLMNVPVAVGDRSSSVQDISCALQGMRFPVEGDAVRLFLQWGKGLPAQHLDMDLSCHIAFADGHTEECAYFNLQATGAKHGGDIRSIPDMVGTAEYIELNLPELCRAGARYVTFTCNAYSCGSLSPNLVVGWMDSAYPMKVSEETGVAYDPSCVQHMVRVGDDNLAKGLVFGVLDVDSRQVIWLEMASTGQTVRSFNFKAVELMLRRLSEKVTIGEALMLKADAQGLEAVASPDAADEAYTAEWALNPAAVSATLLP